MGFYDAFFGSDQSLYTAYAIMAAIIAICITILLTATDVPISNRIMVVLFVVITLVPSIFLTLFELTCIVTGGTEPNNWWCYTFAWVLAAFIIIYCVFIVIISLLSLFSYNNAIDAVKNNENNDRLSPDVSNNYAKAIIDTQNQKEAQKNAEKFYVENNMSDPSLYMAGLNNIMNTSGLNSTALLNSISSLAQPSQQPPKTNEKFYVDDNEDNNNNIDPMKLFNSASFRENNNLSSSENNQIANFANKQQEATTIYANFANQTPKTKDNFINASLSSSADVGGSGAVDITGKLNNANASVGTNANIAGSADAIIGLGYNSSNKSIPVSSSDNVAKFSDFSDFNDPGAVLYPFPDYKTAFNPIN